MIYQVQAPDGSIIKIEGPENATDEQLIQAASAGYQPKKPSMSAGDVAVSAVTNLPSSLGNMVGDIYQAVTNPVQTAKSVLDLGAGTLQNILPESLVKMIGEDKPSRDVANQVGQYYSQRYGTGEGIKNAIATDPAGVMADLSTVLTGGAAIAPKVASVPLKAAARSVDPLALTAKGIGKAVDLTGTAAKIGAGVSTGVGREALGEAYRVGKAGGKEASTFVDNLMGRVEPTEVLNAAKQNVAEMGRQRQAAYRVNMENIKGDKSILSFDGIDDALKSAQNQVSYKGQVTNEAAASKLSDIQQKINEWKSLDPAAYHTPEGLDALKKSIGETLESIPFESKQQRMVVGDVYNAVKNEITKQAPTYAKTMKAYSEATDQIKEIEKALSLGKKASVDTAMRKLQSLTRNNVNTNYGQRLNLAKQLESAGGQQIMPALAGQALSELTPRGLQGAASTLGTIGTFSVGGLPSALAYGAASSPRLMGSAAYGAGVGARGLLDVRNKLPNVDYPTMLNLLYQTQQFRE
jgi:hypothetical protein